MRGLLLLVVVIGCTKPQPQADQVTAPPPQLQAQDAAHTPPPDAPPADASVPPDALLPDAGSGSRNETADGEGACKQDSDCEPSNWQPGCCLSTCETYAVSHVLLAKRIKKEACPAVPTKPCPPPAPCPVRKYRAIDAFCSNGTCALHQLRLKP